MGLTGYLIRRAINSFLLVLGALVLVFLLTHIVAPNPAAVWAGPHASPVELQAVAREYNLNQPAYLQLYYYIQEVFTFNFGISPFFKQPVSTLIETYLPRTLELDFIAMAITIVIGVFTGAFAAAHKDRLGDHSVRAFYLLTWSAPPFFVALILQAFFAYDWNIFPASNIIDPALFVPKPITGFVTIDALLEGNYPVFYSSLSHLVLPTVALALISFGIITRIMRSGMLEALRSDYVRTATMKGLSRTRIVYVHALKNSLIPVITVIALTFAYLIAGSVVIEEIFGYEGIGYLITSALYNFDYPTLIACTIVIAIIVVITNFMADVLYGLVDPKIRLGD